MIPRNFWRVEVLKTNKFHKPNPSKSRLGIVFLFLEKNDETN
jgi:hypothetical protein